MKYIVLIIGLLVVGCGKQEQTDANESTPTTTEKPVKELTLREKVVGTYEVKKDEDTHRAVLLENGIWENYRNGKKLEEDHKWTIINGKLLVEFKDGYIAVLRINKDGSITAPPLEDCWLSVQLTLKKIK